MSAAKKIRQGRFLSPTTGKGIIIPIDHGLTVGPLKGIETTGHMRHWLRSPHIDGVIAHKGMVERLAARGCLTGGVMVHLNGMTVLAPSPDTKELLTSVEAAARLGADAVSLQVNFTGENDAHNLTMLGKVADEAAALGLPVLTMLYDMGPLLPDKKRIQRQRHLLRAAIELGSDMLKISLPHVAEVAPLLEDLAEEALIFVAGGAVAEEGALLAQISTAIHYGAAGVCVGRNVFERTNPAEFLAMLAATIHGHQSMAVELRQYGTH
jgi:class I fructose-bisphosphate aldolase/fructose-bisphosphate aldolase/2-amino-3,7-dideoxy-D-threo-hept-6-ulosonate synthase